MAIGTDARNLSDRAAGLEVGVLGRTGDRIEHRAAGDLRDSSAALAGQEKLVAVGIVVHVSGEERVPALKAMDDAGTQQRVDGPIHGNRRQPAASLPHALENVIGADRVM